MQEDSFTEWIYEDTMERVRELLTVRVRLRVSFDVKKTPWYFGGGTSVTVTVSGPRQQVLDARAELSEFLRMEQADRSW